MAYVVVTAVVPDDLIEPYLNHVSRFKGTVGMIPFVYAPALGKSKLKTILKNIAPLFKDWLGK